MQSLEEEMASALELARNGSLERAKPSQLKQLSLELDLGEGPKICRPKAGSITLPIKKATPQTAERRRTGSLKRAKAEYSGRKRSSLIGYEAKYPVSELEFERSCLSLAP